MRTKYFKVLLTKPEIDVLLYHFKTDVNHGIFGTFGDENNLVSYDHKTGEMYRSKTDTTIAKIVVSKLEKVIKS